MRVNPDHNAAETQAASQTSAVSSATQAAKSSQAQPSSTTIVRDTTDRANLSSDALQLSNLSATLATVPEVRPERVASVTQAIQNGSFAPSNDQIASSLLRDFRSSATQANG